MGPLLLLLLLLLPNSSSLPSTPNPTSLLLIPHSSFPIPSHFFPPSSHSQCPFHFLPHPPAFFLFHSLPSLPPFPVLPSLPLNSPPSICLSNLLSPLPLSSPLTPLPSPLPLPAFPPPPQGRLRNKNCLAWMQEETGDSFPKLSLAQLVMPLAVNGVSYNAVLLTRQHSLGDLSHNHLMVNQTFHKLLY